MTGYSDSDLGDFVDNIIASMTGNARAYQVRYSVNGGAWLPIVDSTQARRIILPNLTPGTTYTVQSRAVGGTTGYSEWSDPSSHMAMWVAGGMASSSSQKKQGRRHGIPPNQQPE